MTCVYCDRKTDAPKPKYRLVTDGSENGRYYHHVRRVRINGIEVLPACELTRLAGQRRRERMWR